MKYIGNHYLGKAFVKKSIYSIKANYILVKEHNWNYFTITNFIKLNQYEKRFDCIDEKEFSKKISCYTHSLDIACLKFLHNLNKL